jgi:hypothetical protein
LHRASLAIVALLAGCASPAPTVVPDPLEAQEATLQPGWSLWLTYSVYNTTTFPFEWTVTQDVPVQFTVYRTKSTGEEVLYTTTATSDAGNVTARHPNIHAFVWRNINDANVTVSLGVAPGYQGARYPPGGDPATTNCPTLCM